MSLSKSSSFLASFWCFVLTVTLVFIVIRSGSCLFACHHIITLFQGCYNYLIVLIIQDSEWMFLIFHMCIEAAGVWLGNLTHIYNITMTVLILVECSCVSDVRCKSKS